MVQKEFFIFIFKEMNGRIESFMSLFKMRLCALFVHKLAKCFVSANHIYVTRALLKRQLLVRTLRKNHA